MIPTRTFLFTDIEGSTRRWEAFPAAMRAALARHDALLRTAIEDHGGTVFKTIGDAFCAVFTDPAGALAAAIAGQHALAAEPWPADIGGLRVRMALHVGVADERDGDYFGPALNRVARLLAAGHGGQVLLSLAVREAFLAATTGAELRFRDLGEHRLKDLARPEHIYQLLAPGLPADYPPLVTVDLRPNNLPQQPTPLLGRQRELAELTERLISRADRLVTITGPGGTGKTRLAIQVAAEALDAFPQGVYFVDLAPLTDPARVPGAIAVALGLVETAGEPIQETLGAWLAGKRLLLVLDNFEQVLPAAPHVADLVATCPALGVLVTSRAALRLRWEHEYPLAPMPVPPEPRRTTPEALTQYVAVQLFVERARAVQPGFAVTRDNAPVIAEICARLDGLPLAIELAAARARLLAPRAILERLDQRLRLLTAGPRDLPARQQTMRDAIAWSYELLGAPEQHLFRWLAVFSGGWTLAAAEAVCGADGGVEVLDGLAALIENSLVRAVDGPDGEPRYTMLETIRAYGQEQLAVVGDLDLARCRHGAAFAALAGRAGLRMCRDDQRLWLEWLAADLDNLRALFAWARDHDPDLGLETAFQLEHWWWKANHMTEGADLLTALLAHPGVSDRPRALGQIVLGRIAFAMGDQSGAGWDGEAAVTVLERCGTPADVARALDAMMYAMPHGTPPERRAAVRERCRRQATAIGDDVILANCMDNEAIQVCLAGDLVRAQTLMEETLRRQRAVGNVSEIAWTLNNIAFLVFLPRGDLAAARRYLVEALDVAGALGSQHVIAGIQDSLGRVELAAGDLPAARAAFAAGLAAAVHGGSRYGSWQNHQGLAIVARRADQPERAATLLGAAERLHLSRSVDMHPPDRVPTDAEIAAVRASLGEAAFAAAWSAGQAMTLDEALAHAVAEEGAG